MDETDEDYEIRVEEAGGCKVTGFCPLCKVQATAFTCDTVANAIVDHMNEFHPRRENVTVPGKFGSA